jgi:tripartite-type tricarboxylate transporter receptor subunit TctC
MEAEMRDCVASCNQRRRAFLGALPLIATPFAFGQPSFPAKPVRILVGATPGGGTDALARLWADAAAALLRQPVIVENRSGANGIIASELLARSPSDGYTLALVQNTHTLNPATFRKLPYDTLADFSAVGTLARSPLVVVASAATGVKSLKDLMEFARREPKGVSFGSAEASARISAEAIRIATGLPISVVPYKGTGPVIADIAGHHLNFTVTTIASTLPFKGSGKLNYVAVLGRERSPFLPDVPTIAEQDGPGIEAIAWWGLVGPARLPADVLKRLSDVTSVVLADPDVRKKLAALAVEPWNQSPENFDKFIRKEADLAIKSARQAGIEPE